MTTETYDANNNRTTLTDPIGNVTTFIYDALNRVKEEQDPLGNSATFAFDEVGRMASTTDRLGHRRDFAFDEVGRNTTETWISSGNTINVLTFTYDIVGNRLTAEDQNGSYTFTYDGLNRVDTVQSMFDVTLTLTYDLTGNRTLVEDSFGGVTTSMYDAVNRLESRRFGGSGQTSLRTDFTYTVRDQIENQNRFSDLTGTTKVGESTFTYDAANRQTHIKHANGSGTALAEYTYTYDSADRLTAETINGTTNTFAYDNTNQLTADGANTFTYDLNGNRTMSGYQTNTGNRLVNNGTFTYTYDIAGNMVKKSKGDNQETWEFGYDHRNQLIWAEERNTDGGDLLMRSDYTYDVFGNRIEKVVDADGAGSGSSLTTRFAQDGWNPARPTPRGLENYDAIAELDANNDLQRRLLHGDEVDQFFARIGSSGDVSWYLPDHLGSLRDITDDTGALIDHRMFEAFGNMVSETSPANGDVYGYTGRFFDGETGLQHNRARYYDPINGRWISTDPIGFEAGDTDLYRYAGNGPTNGTDPSGLDYIEVNGSDVNWVIQKDGVWFYNPVDRTLCIGELEDGTVNFDNKFGGGKASLTSLEEFADKFWRQYDDISKLSAARQDSYLKNALNSVRSERTIDSRGAFAEYVKSAADGANDGAGFVINRVTCKQFDSLNQRCEEKLETGGELYVWADRSAMVADESLKALVMCGVFRGVLKGADVGLKALNAGEKTKTIVTFGVQTANVYFTAKSLEASIENADGAIQAYRSGDEHRAWELGTRSTFQGVFAIDGTRNTIKFAKSPLGRDVFSKLWADEEGSIILDSSFGKLPSNTSSTTSGTRLLNEFGRAVNSRGEVLPIEGPSPQLVDSTGRPFNSTPSSTVTRFNKDTGLPIVADPKSPSILYVANSRGKIIGWIELRTGTFQSCSPQLGHQSLSSTTPDTPGSAKVSLLGPDGKPITTPPRVQNPPGMALNRVGGSSNTNAEICRTLDQIFARPSDLPPRDLSPLFFQNSHGKLPTGRYIQYDVPSLGGGNRGVRRLYYNQDTGKWYYSGNSHDVAPHLPKVSANEGSGANMVEIVDVENEFGATTPTLRP